MTVQDAAAAGWQVHGVGEAALALGLIERGVNGLHPHRAPGQDDEGQGQREDDET